MVNQPDQKTKPINLLKGVLCSLELLGGEPWNTMHQMVISLQALKVQSQSR